LLLLALLLVANVGLQLLNPWIAKSFIDGAQAGVPVEGLTLTAIENAPIGGRYVLALARDVTERVRKRVREAAALRVARTIRADASPERLLDDLLEEAVAIVGGDAATVYGWDNAPGGLLVVRNTVKTSGTYVPSAHGAVGRAVDQRAPVIVNDYQREPGMVASTLRAFSQCRRTVLSCSRA